LTLVGAEQIVGAPITSPGVAISGTAALPCCSHDRPTDRHELLLSAALPLTHQVLDRRVSNSFDRRMPNVTYFIAKRGQNAVKVKSEIRSRKFCIFGRKFFRQEENLP